MANMSLKKVAIQEQDPQTRNKNFAEVAIGYTPAMAIEEATRCLQCKHKPCVAGCPVKVRIPEFIEKVAAGDFEAAYDIITSTNAMPAICGRVCPQESQCESKCILGIKGEPVAIGRLERFVADYARTHNLEKITPAAAGVAKKQKVAVIGSGPSGLTAAGDLAKMGYQVTIFEALHAAGGVLMYGIPPFRLPKDIVQYEIKNLERLGVKIIPNAIIGKTFTIADLMLE